VRCVFVGSWWCDEHGGGNCLVNEVKVGGCSKSFSAQWLIV